MRDISDWEREEENRGSHDGVWVLEPQSRRRGLAKHSRVYRVAGQPFECAEAGAELLASQVGRLLGLPVPEVEIVCLDRRVSCLSWSFVEPGYQLHEGVDLVGSQDDRRISVDEARDILARYVGTEQATKHVIHLVCFDILIGNSDRHLANWGILAPTRPQLPYLMAPYYDNGSAFGSNLAPDRVAGYLESEETRKRFDRRFRYEMAVVGSQRAKIRDLLQKLLEWHNELAGFAHKLQKLTDDAVCQMLLAIDPKAMSEDRKAFARTLLLRRSTLIQGAVAACAS